MQYRMVNGKLQTKIVESSECHFWYGAIGFQRLLDRRDRKEHHSAKVKIIAHAPWLIIIQGVKGLRPCAFIIEIRIGKTCFGRLGHLEVPFQSFGLDRHLVEPWQK